jgi:mannose-1-phosphate guanylyltransferase/phosphomannomutase
MKAIIVSGGKGERLRPLTYTLPKPMIEVAGKPVLEHIINLFKKNGIIDFIISVYYLPEKITKYFGDGKKFGVNIEYIYEKENFPLGTAGNIRAAKELIDSTFIVTYADILRDLSIINMVKFHKNKKSFATLNIYKRFGPNPKSMVLFNKNKKIASFVERPKPEELHDNFVWSNGSFYIFEPSIFDFIPQNTFSDFGKDVFPKLLKERKDLFAFPSTGFFIDIGNYEKLEKARKLMSGHNTNQ